jgi:hypothetical protein
MSTISAAFALMNSSPGLPHGRGSRSAMQMVPGVVPILSISGAPRT